MPLIVPIPQGVRDVLRACADHTGLAGVHPGLVLDKFALSWDDSGITQGLSERVQRPVIEQVVRLSAAPTPDPIEPGGPPDRWFDELVKRWEGLTVGGAAFVGTTAGPLTLHLARASALENAGICLHPIYGFTYLPGSGLKGLARAFAETVWLPAQPEPDRAMAAATVRRIFGYIDGKDEPKSAAGAVVFHDAWPRQWPRLVTDILNSHHAEYYSKQNEPPGDWEDPVPVYFLSVPPGIPFRFALTKRRDDVSQADLDLAADWLAGGLTVLGCGAKTATGYGHFTVDRPPPGAAPQDATRVWGDVAEKAGRKVFRATIELVTPAFLAGADQTDPRSCDLRPATLRGQLRWWWRTLHAGFADVPTLKRIEAAVWGDTTRGGAVRLTVSANGRIQPLLFDREAIIRANRLPPTPDRKTSQGLTYHSYGMDEKKEGQRVTRFYLAPGSKWDVGLIARAGQLAAAQKDGKPIDLPADALLEQARAALALLCRFGGVGAKARKGFGSLADLPGFDLAAIKQSAADFRVRCGLGAAKFQPQLAGSPALEQVLGPLEVPTGGANYWLALDQLAAAAQQFAKRYAHRIEKKALGLPRRVDAPPGSRFQTGRHVAPGAKGRHASPVLYHFDRVGGLLVARVTAFPAAELPNVTDSSRLLKELLTELGSGLGGRFNDHVKGKPAPGAPPVGTAPAQAAPAGPQLKAGEVVKAKLVADPKGKGRPFAEHAGLVGNILNGGDLPGGLEVGAEVSLEIANVNVAAKQIAFRYKK